MSVLDNIALQRALTRRDFLKSAGLASTGAKFFGLGSVMPPVRSARAQKVVVVTFGGGARDEETFAPEGQENIPHLMKELIPQSTFFTQVVNRGILGHYVATASLATGLYESFDNFADISPANPTVFEYFRRGLKRPAQDTWVIAPSNGFNRIGQSDGSHIAPGYGAQVILPKLLLAEAFGADSRDLSASLLQDNFEDIYFRPLAPAATRQSQPLVNLLHLSVEEFRNHAQNIASADELSVYILRHVMQQFSPSLVWVTLHDMDVAHTGAYSLYIDGIRHTDRLCAEIWGAIQSDPEYKNRTTLLILPDFGRDSDISPSGNGFQHHRTGDPLSRTTWMMALGPNIRGDVTVNRQLQSIDLVPTLGALMGFQTPRASGTAVSEIL